MMSKNENKSKQLVVKITDVAFYQTLAAILEVCFALDYDDWGV